MNIDLSAMFILGFLSSFSHCYGMCGGFVMAYSLKTDSLSAGFNRIIPHLLYNSGRVITYSFLGMLFGWLGGTLQNIIQDAQSFLFILSGLFMILIGLDLAGWINLRSKSELPGMKAYKIVIGKLLSNLSSGNIFLYGLVLGFIPCGLVYIAGAQAITSESPTQGILVMMVFGLGTIPALFLLGMGAQYFNIKFRQRIIKIAAVLVMLFGLITVVKGGLKLTDLPMPWMKHSIHQHMDNVH